MGSAIVGLADDPSALFSNPAGLAYLPQGQLTLESRLGLVGTFEETAVLGFPLSPFAGFGLAGGYLGYGTFQGRDSLGSLAPDYQANRMDLQGGLGMELFPGVSLGLALRGFLQNLADHSYTFITSDIGFLAKFPDHWRLGLAAAQIRLGSTPEPMAIAFHAGASYETALDPSTRLLIALGGSYKTDSLGDLRIGTEVSYLSKYFLRAGYQAFLNPNGLDGVSGLTVGAGVALGDFKLDYAYLPNGQVGNSHRFDIGYFFNANGGSPSKDPSGVGQPTRSPVQGQGPSKTSTETLPSASQTVEIAPKLETGSSEEDSLTLHFALAPDFLARGEAMEAQGNYPEAVRLFRELLKQNDQNLKAWWDLGNVYCKLNQKTYAIQCFERILKIKPENQGLRDWLEKYKSQ